MAEKISILLTEEEVDAKIKLMGEQISRDYAGKQVHLVCVLKGGTFFMCELAKRIDIPVTMDFMQVSSYGAETKSSGVVKLIKDLDEPLQGKNVIIIEDIIDSGRTLSHLVKLLGQRDPKTMTLCTLLDKPSRRVTEVDVKYVGGVPVSFPGEVLQIGSTGSDVKTIQNQLNAISNAYPAIAKVKEDGIYDQATADSVKTFQSIFGLPQSGIVDFKTWYELSRVYVAVTKIASLNPII